MITTLVAAVALNWVGVSVYTGKTSEDLYQHYFRTERECWTSPLLPNERSDRVCIPVPELPQELFDEQTQRCIENGNRYYWSGSNQAKHAQACRDAAD